MPIRLEDDARPVPLFTRVINAPRIHHVPLVNFVVALVLGFFLIRLTTKYTGMYQKNSLVTIIITNLVLYGISETLAQSLLSYRANQPQFAFRVDDVPPPSISADEGVFETEEEGIDRFIDFIQREEEQREEEVVTQPLVPLTYFQFDRLAGFMSWGIIMGFCQCLWYKFLQIYAKDPKFIEVVRKVLTDQLCYSPVSLFAFFTYGTIVLEKGTWDDTRAKLSKIYLKTLIINYSVWFPVQFFNFLIVPRSFQVPFSSSISVLWNCFLSMRNSTA